MIYNSLNNGAGSPQLSQIQSIGSSKQLFNKTISKEYGQDDYNIPELKEKVQQNNYSQFKDGMNRSQQIANKRQNLYNQFNKTNNIEENDQMAMSIEQQKKLNVEDVKGDNVSQSPFTPLNKKKVRLDLSTNNSINRPLIIKRVNTIENQMGYELTNELETQILRNKGSNISDEEEFKLNPTLEQNLEQENFQQSRQSSAISRKKNREVSLGLILSQNGNNDQQKQKKVNSSITFAKNDTIHYFEDSDKAEEFAQFIQIQKDASTDAKQKYEVDRFAYKSILRAKSPVKRQLSKSQQLVPDKQEEDKSSGDTPTSFINTRKRQVIQLPNQSNFGKQLVTQNLKQSKKGKRESTSKVFGNLKGSYEKDNYIKRLSSIQHLNLERFIQLMKNKESLRMKYQKMFMVVYNLIKNIFTLKLVQIDSLEHSTIHFYSVALNYFKLFQSTTLTGTLFFIYCYFQINDLNKELLCPFTCPLNEKEDKIIFLSGQSKPVTHLGLLLLILLIVQIFYSGVFADSSIFSEKQAMRLIFSSIKWNTFCENRYHSLTKKYKLYDKIMEDQDIYEGQYPQSTLIFLIIAETCLMSTNIGVLYIALDDSKIPYYLYTISIFSSYSILTHITIGAIVISLIIFNLYAIEKIYIVSIKISFSTSERFMVRTMIFNTLFIYCFFQARQIVNFNENLDFEYIKKQETLTPVLRQVQSQIGFVIALCLLYLIQSVIKYILFKEQNYYSSQFRMQGNKVSETTTTNPIDEQKKRIQDGDNNKLSTQRDEIEVKSVVIKPQRDIYTSPEFDCSPTPFNNNTQKMLSSQNSPQFIQLKPSTQKQKSSNSYLIFESAYYVKHIIFANMMNASLLNCIFTFPLILPFGVILNFLLMISLYVQSQRINPSSCQTFLTKREFSQLANIIIYLFIGITMGTNFLIGMSNFNNSDIVIKESLFTTGLNYLLNVDEIKQFFYIISMPYLLYATIFYLIASLYRQNQQHKQQFSNFKYTIQKLRGPSNQAQSVPKIDVPSSFNY